MDNLGPIILKSELLEVHLIGLEQLIETSDAQLLSYPEPGFGYQRHLRLFPLQPRIYDLVWPLIKCVNVHLALALEQQNCLTAYF
jgi:hypothetical protein